MNDLSDNDWHAMSDDDIARQIGGFIKFHRMQQNKTQEMLAKESGISRSTLSLLERGETVTVATLIQVLRVLDLLQVFDKFTVTRQPSPLALAKAEQKKRQRVASPRKKNAINPDDTDW
ncbi:transcriptional regulator with XRE-family HTH domain [Parabacteroides sp. PFB2-12]|uniref:helix-turn-helix domain-containing protein n=1 Tax=unclassified Parabacteroides TaxID=2649774 RepID=UPI002473A651|nr:MULTISPECIES: helix-turn-helix transcriptional regulator [unclassified Parabacteroides]MDH6343371.1 transcriptional regulator with XRE-family HTH domain [Parabacteroides sp. PM6-13]MDH6390387.1 transcriptional regulator with XRE-family HTH domain [Parabacteroides sp. PFB2-12]